MFLNRYSCWEHANIGENTSVSSVAPSIVLGGTPLGLDVIGFYSRDLRVVCVAHVDPETTVNCCCHDQQQQPRSAWCMVTSRCDDQFSLAAESILHRAHSLPPTHVHLTAVRAASLTSSADQLQYPRSNNYTPILLLLLLLTMMIITIIIIIVQCNTI